MKKAKRIAVVLAALLLMLCLLIPSLVSCGSKDPKDPYQEAMKLIKDKKYTEAYKILVSIEDDDEDYDKAQIELKKFKLVLTKITGPDGDIDKITYNENGQPTKIVIKNGKVTETTEYTYDANGHLTYEKRDGDYIEYQKYYPRYPLWRMTNLKQEMNTL